MSLDAYQRTRKITELPRSTEFRLVSQITAEMISARDAGLKGAGLMAALHRNREMWSTFASACAAPGNALPDTLRAGIISLALWADRFTSDVMANRESVDDLIDVNRMLLEGLAPEKMAA